MQLVMFLPLQGIAITSINLQNGSNNQKIEEKWKWLHGTVDKKASAHSSILTPCMVHWCIGSSHFFYAPRTCCADEVMFFCFLNNTLDKTNLPVCNQKVYHRT